MTSIRLTGTTLNQHIEGAQGIKLITVIPVRFKKRGACTVMVSPEADRVQADGPFLGNIPLSCDTVLLTALGRAFHWQRLLDEGIAASGSAIAQHEGLHPSTVNELLRLTLLAPDIIDLLIAGRQPKTMTLLWFQRHPLPIDWSAQREIVAQFAS